ncbi:MAG: pyruvate dehydrogenase (acetyl-transferring) E1 component subunit alpha [Magnetococcales bacterium]|nr:pyruvate dehydrogenase (acetyl-transferring) E1 component subunit alpha [Magnetococcales bacterium]PPR19493.1 MAG: Acetoin:2,6-dichlorophenolindophenol oxidoreductase subunit alpha [Pseudomonadota bacterium]
MAVKSAAKKKFNLVKSLHNQFTKEDLLAQYESMIQLRRFQEKVGSLYQQGYMGGFCHLYIGQEAVITGAKAASKEGDDFITTYRCHAHAAMSGISMEEILGELMGRSTGISKGKGGSMHMFDPDKHFWGGHGIVGGNVPLATGMAFAAKYREEDRVTLCFFGDGAADSGAMFESFNMAALWKLPVLYIIENNHFSMGTAKERHAAGEFYKRGEPFGIPGKKVDGMDFFAVYEAISEACEYIRAGNGPMLLEMDTYRYKGHSMSDPAKYRKREDVDGIKTKRDPIMQLGNVLMSNYKVKEEDLKALDKKAKEAVAKAVEIALDAPKADMAELYTDIIQSNGEK